MAELAAAGTLSKIGAKGMGSGAAYLHDLMQYAGDMEYHAPEDSPQTGSAATPLSS